ncbi:hypothetical protein ABT340_34850 [Streptosporangium sp. NPDC000239]|uniref:hypothetical protein n=1 Tax=Streptosporangium sp. NPDC000239 TaxID=3154248 RepID=UPI0033334403
MNQPILGQRSRGELITELYDTHAAGLFAYCHDQLGDPGAAGTALAAVFATVASSGASTHASSGAVSDARPPRAALYALARREIHQRDVVHAAPLPGADPVSLFVDRVLHDLRPHQREVLYLSGVCEMDTAELSWVLDVAADTADELTVSACRRFAQSLQLALVSARVPAHLADAFGALGVAPIRDVLVRAPWAVPPAGLRAAVLGLPGAPALPPVSPTRTPALPVSLRPLWPTPPAWPLPLADTDALTSTSVFATPELPPPFSPADFFPAAPARDNFPDPFSPPDPDVVSAHEATTEPMPKLKDSVLSALDEIVPRTPRRRLQRPKPRGAKPLPAPIPGDVLDDAPTTRQEGATEDLFQPFTPEPRPRQHSDKLVAAAPRETAPEDFAAFEASGVVTPLPGWPLRAEELDAAAPVLPEPEAVRPAPAGWPLRTDELGTVEASAEAPVEASVDSSDFTDSGDRARHARRPGRSARRTGAHRGAHAEQPGDDAPAPAPLPEGLPEDLSGVPDSPREIPAEPETAGVSEKAPATRLSRLGGRARRRRGQARRGGQRHDWAWELFGFVICVVCVAIAMLVFFAMPTPLTP